MDKTKASQRDVLSTHVRRKSGNVTNAPRFSWKERPQSKLKPKRNVAKSRETDEAETQNEKKSNSEDTSRKETNQLKETDSAKESKPKDDIQVFALPTRDENELPVACPTPSHDEKKLDSSGISTSDKAISDLEARIKNLDANKPTNRIPEPDLRSDILNSLDMIQKFSRRNLFPGVGQTRSESWTKSVYNAEVHRLRFPETDDHKLKKNEFNEWNENNFIRIKMKKMLEEERKRWLKSHIAY